MYAILLMNALVPFINRATRRASSGRTHKVTASRSGETAAPRDGWRPEADASR